MLTVAPVLAIASRAVSNTGNPKCFSPPRPGVTPPTSLVPYAKHCSECSVPCLPVKPWQMTLVFLFTRIDMDVLFRIRLMAKRLLRSGDGFLRSVVQIDSGGQRQAARIEQLAACIGIGTF